MVKTWRIDDITYAKDENGSVILSRENSNGHNISWVHNPFWDGDLPQPPYDTDDLLNDLDNLEKKYEDR